MLEFTGLRNPKALNLNLAASSRLKDEEDINWRRQGGVDGQ